MVSKMAIAVIKIGITEAVPEAVFVKEIAVGGWVIFTK